jgi:hypothetical protein
MAKVYAVRIETRESIIVYESDTPITMGRLSNIINNYSSSSKIVSINVYDRTITDVE